MYDIIVIGGGPAGLTAALYALRANKKVLIIEKHTFGGQITYSPRVENIPGFTEISGNEFAEKMVEQVLFQGADTEASEALAIKDGKIKTVVTESGEFEARAVIIATGAKHRLLGVKNEEKYIGDGISFCAVCDGAFYANKRVAVIGGGNSALQEAILLSELAETVYIVQNLPYLTGEKKLQNQLKDNVEVILGNVVEEYLGDTALSGILIRDEKCGITQELDVDGVFLAVGLIPQNDAFADLLPLDERGYVKADDTLSAGRDGIFVAGDCRQKSVRQVTTAVSDGAIAALAACEYIDSAE